MALYEYRCPQGHSNDVFHPADESPEIHCEACGEPAERAFSVPMIHTQYYFSPQVHGAKKPRPAPDPAPAPAAAVKPARTAKPSSSPQTGTPKASS